MRFALRAMLALGLLFACGSAQARLSADSSDRSAAQGRAGPAMTNAMTNSGPTRGRLLARASGGAAETPSSGALFDRDTPQAVAAKAADFVSVRDFCPTVDDATDNTACTQAAVDALCGRGTTEAGGGSGTLWFPTGRYHIGSVLIPCSGITLAGAGIGDRDQNASGTKITGIAPAKGPTDDGCSIAVFHFAVTKYANADGAGAPARYSRESYGGVVRDMGFYDSVSATFRRPMICLEHTAMGQVYNTYYYGVSGAVWVRGGLQNHISDAFADGSQTGATVFRFYGDSVGMGPHDVSGRNAGDVTKLDHVAINSGAGGTCLSIEGFAHTLQSNNITCETSGKGVSITCSDSAAALGVDDCPGFLTFNDLEIEGFGNGATLLDASDFKLLKLVNPYLRGTLGATPGQGTNNLISLHNQNYRESGLVVVQGGWLRYAGGSCIYGGVQQVQVLGSTITDCNGWNNGGAGVEILQTNAAPAGRSVVTGNIFCVNEYGTYAGSGQNGSGARTMRAVLLGAKAGGNVVTGNVMSGCAPAGPSSVQDNSGGKNLVVPNLGP